MTRMTRSFTLTLALCGGLLLGACSQHDVSNNFLAHDAQVTEVTRSYMLLKSLPPASDKIAVAVYNFDDQTGQFKSNERVTEYSSAVTKGGLAILNNALLSAGSKGWFTVIERGGLKNILQERQIIRAMRQQYALPGGQRLPEIPPMLYAGMLIEGGIIGYDTNTLTGGVAANYFGIGGNSQYRSDRVSVYLRAINIQTGEVMISVTSTKTVYSMGLQGNVFKYMTVDRILQAETGFTMNEPVQLAVRQAIETAVYSLIMEGAVEGVWGFADSAKGQQAMTDYLARKEADGMPVEDMLKREYTAATAPKEDKAPTRGTVLKSGMEQPTEYHPQPAAATTPAATPTAEVPATASPADAASTSSKKDESWWSFLPWNRTAETQRAVSQTAAPVVGAAQPYSSPSGNAAQDAPPKINGHVPSSPEAVKPAPSSVLLNGPVSDAQLADTPPPSPPKAATGSDDWWTLLPHNSTKAAPAPAADVKPAAAAPAATTRAPEPVKSSPAAKSESKPKGTTQRPTDENAMIRYLDDSLKSQRHTPAGNCDKLDGKGNCIGQTAPR